MRFVSSFASLAIATLALATDAHAGMGLSVEAILGVTGEAEADQLTCKVGCTGSQSLDDEDLEGNVGFAVTYERALRPQIRIGGRFSYMAGEGDTTEQEMSAYGGGLWGRYVIPVHAKAALHLGADVGPTYLASEATVLGVKTDFTGTGFHVLLGAGGSAQLTEQVELRGGIYYSYESVGSMDAEENGIEVEVEDTVATRVLLTAGLGF